MSKKEPIYIQGVSIKDFKCFKGDNLFSFANEDKWFRWTIFLGNNNTGKTNLLKSVASLEPYKSTLGKDTVYSAIGFYLNPFKTEINNTTFNAGIKFAPLKKEKSKANINPANPNNNDLIYTNKLAMLSSDNSLLNISIYGYGVVRNIESKEDFSQKNSLNPNSDNLFNNSNLVNFENWLFQLYIAQRNETASKKVQELAKRKYEVLKKVLISDIFPDINDIRFTTDGTLNNYIEFQTENGWYKTSELGYGYQATLAWLMDFSKKLFDRYPESENPLKEPAILLVDEIDLHLHPQWQRGLVKYLSDIFPATQFIVTTHSPFIIQSMESVNLYTLRKDGDHTTVKHWGNRSFIGWGIEEILSEVMELGNNIQTDAYQKLMQDFDNALDNDNYNAAKDAYDELVKILHPQSAERKLLDIQLSQLTQNDKA